MSSKVGVLLNVKASVDGSHRQEKMIKMKYGIIPGLFNPGLAYNHAGRLDNFLFAGFPVV